MSSLTLFAASNLSLLLEEDGIVNAPFSIYLNDRFDNPHTKEVVAAGLRVLHRFLHVFRIDLPARALEGECLKAVECKWLAQLAYRSLPEIEQMSDSILKRHVTANKNARPSDLKGAVEPNTAAKRVMTAADFLDWYRRSLLDEVIRSTALREQLQDRYSITCAALEGKIRATKQGSHSNIRSLPTQRYLQVIRELVLNPRRIFPAAKDGQIENLMRDRAMALLAAEGLRPGAIGNLTVDDFRYIAGDSRGYVVIKDNESPRILWRLNTLRGLSHEEVEQVFT